MEHGTIGKHACKACGDTKGESEREKEGEKKSNVRCTRPEHQRAFWSVGILIGMVEKEKEREREIVRE